MWGPKFTHNISLFYPEAILHYFGIAPGNPSYIALLTKVTGIIELEVGITAVKLNMLVRQAFRKDLWDIEEYMTLPEYWTALDLALSSPKHTGVTWNKKLVQARFIDTDALGGLRELQEIQHEVYPSGKGNVGAWASLYSQWIRGEDDSIGKTLQQRLSIMMSRGVAPFAELIETGNDMYPAYPHHIGKGTLERFKPVYRREMRATYHKVIGMVELLLPVAAITTALTATVIMAGGVAKSGFNWVSAKGNTIFVNENTLRLSGGRLVGSGYIISPQGQAIRSWSGWLPK